MFKWIALALAGFLGTANAAENLYAFTVIPAQPTGGQAFQIRVTKAFDPCGLPLHPTILPTKDLGGGVIQYIVPGGDGCELNLPPQDITYNVPALAAGSYTFRFDICGFFPTDCYTLEERAVTVLGQAGFTRHTIPTLSSLGAISLAALLCIAAALLRFRWS